MNKRKNKHGTVLYMGCFVSVCVIMLIALKITGAAPFGSLSLANNDAYIQYLDLFAWLKDILAGKNNIAYTFSKSLGGSGIAIFSYYLSSPLNLLVSFFKKSQLTVFFDILVMIKLALASTTCSIWLNKRFEGEVGKIGIYFLALGYGLCQYNLVQSSNIMWLDGVIILPLMLLGIYRGIWKNNWWYLSAFCAISILANWYSGAINCIFVVGWAFVEMCLYIEEKHESSVLLWVRKVSAGIVSMLTGILISAVLFYPTIKGLLGGKGGTDNQFLSSDMMGNVLSVLPGFSVGANCNYYNGAYVSLFCGSFAVVCCIGLFVSRSVRKCQKVIMGCVLCFSVLIFYWQPFIWLFSMMREVSSYWYRYSYIGTIGIIFCAAFYIKYIRKNKSNYEKISFIFVTAFFAFGMLGMNKKYLQQNEKYVLLAVITIVAIMMFLILLGNAKKQTTKNILWLAIAGIVISELGLNSELLIKSYGYDDAYRAENYNDSQQSMISQIQNIDSSNYRITQLKNRLIYDNHLTGTYNEALAFNYKSISGYTSALDMKQAVLLERLGYRLNGETYSIVNTSILSSDSLLGVKYVLSDRKVDGLTETDEFTSFDGKDVYENLYSLPIAFKCAASGTKPEYTGNTFIYQNELYSELLGEDVEIYKPVDYEVLESQNEYVYKLNIPDKQCVLYGNLVWDTEFDATLNVNDVYTTAYARWASPSVFDIPVQKNQKQAKVQLSTQKNISIKDAQFYALDLTVFKYVTDKLQSQATDVLEMDNGYVKIETDGHSSEYLFTSIPMDEGWCIAVNDKNVSPKLFAGSLIMIPLEDGINTIEMTYQIPGFHAGVFISIIGIIILFFEILFEKKNSSNI